jgi:ABC-type multidrug transport system fused ATPase/permease subunit
VRRLAAIIFSFTLALNPLAKADMFGGDVVVLAQILANAIQQLVQLKSILENGQDNLNLLKDINRGINDSLNLIRTISPNSDPGLYKDWQKVSDALTQIENIYGIVVESKDSKVQKDTDQTVAEAISLNNSIYKYAKVIDEIGEMIKQQSHHVSPGGAAKLTAQSLGVMLNLQNEMLRTQGTGLKLQAQSLALQNRKDKERTRQMTDTADKLNSALAGQNPKFELPRFE